MDIKRFLVIISIGLCACSRQVPQRTVAENQSRPEPRVLTRLLPLQETRLASRSRTAPAPTSDPLRLKLGSERLFEPEYFSLIEGKRVAIMANQTSRDTVDRLIDDRRTRLVVIFGPEHGFFGKTAAGQPVMESEYRGVPVHARYGGGDETRRIPQELFKDIDVLLFEIQDIGTRHYTFISSMYLAMDSAADAHVEFVVLDRPVAVNGFAVEGPMLDSRFQTFVGVGRLANRYGMTIGELARMFREEAGLMNGPRYPRLAETDAYYNVKDLKLTVIPMLNYNRLRCYDEQAGAREWIPPSPNIPTVDSAICYVGAGLFDGNTIAEIVPGYEQFSHIGFPFIKSAAELDDFIAAAKKIYGFPGVELEPVTDTRTGTTNIVRLKVRDRLTFNSSCTALAFLYVQAARYGQTDFYSSKQGAAFFRIIHGNEWFSAMLAGPEPLPPFAEIVARIEQEVDTFKDIRKKYLLY